MKIWLYVEGESDRLALTELWVRWQEALQSRGHGIRIIPLEAKPRFLKKIGPRAAEKLAASGRDIVVALPDFYPNVPYANTDLRHETVDQLRELQRRAVARALENVFRIGGENLSQALTRFFASTLKHDMEMLLLAAKDQLRDVLGTKDRLGNWRAPVEEQDQQGRHPKRIVEELFRTKTAPKRAYRDTKDAPAVMRKVRDIRQIVFLESGIVNCPLFKEMLDWVGGMTGVPAYA